MATSPIRNPSGKLTKLPMTGGDNLVIRNPHATGSVRFTVTSEGMKRGSFKIVDRLTGDAIRTGQTRSVLQAAADRFNKTGPPSISGSTPKANPKTQTIYWVIPRRGSASEGWGPFFSKKEAEAFMAKNDLKSSVYWLSPRRVARNPILPTTVDPYTGRQLTADEAAPLRDTDEPITRFTNPKAIPKAVSKLREGLEKRKREKARAAKASEAKRFREAMMLQTVLRAGGHYTSFKDPKGKRGPQVIVFRDPRSIHLTLEDAYREALRRKPELREGDEPITRFTNPVSDLRRAQPRWEGTRFVAGEIELGFIGRESNIPPFERAKPWVATITDPREPIARRATFFASTYGGPNQAKQKAKDFIEIAVGTHNILGTPRRRNPSRDGRLPNPATCPHCHSPIGKVEANPGYCSGCGKQVTI